MSKKPPCARYSPAQIVKLYESGYPLRALARMVRAQKIIRSTEDALTWVERIIFNHLAGRRLPEPL